MSRSVPRCQSERSQGLRVPCRDERPVSAPADRASDDKFGVSVNLGRIDMVHAEIEAGLKRRDRRFAVSEVDCQVPMAMKETC